jgi:SAM-dependent methyltransferase
MRCPACDADLEGAPAFRGHDRLHGTPGAYAVVRCPRCGSGRTLPDASAAELAAFYPDDYGPYDERMSPLAARISKLIRWWQVRRGFATAPLRAVRDARSGRVVDVGCGRGDLAAGFVARGWVATGVEPSPSACAIARSRGVDARPGTLADVPLEVGAYDAAVFQHSLEHTPDPIGDLRTVHGALRPGGAVLVTVPNFGSWQARRGRSRWYHLDLPRHRTHFTESGLRRALERAGFGVEELTTSTSTVGLPATIQYALAGRCLFPAGMALRVASALCTLLLPVARVADRLGGGGDQLHAVARRPEY